MDGPCERAMADRNGEQLIQQCGSLGAILNHSVLAEPAIELAVVRIIHIPVTVEVEVP